MNEWKIDTWWKKTLITVAMIEGFITIIVFITGVILGVMEGLV